MANIAYGEYYVLCEIKNMYEFNDQRNRKQPRCTWECALRKTAHLRSQILVFNEIIFDTYTSIPHKSVKFIALPARHKHLLDAEYHANQLNKNVA